MKIKLTKKQIESLKQRLKDNIKNEEYLRVRSKTEYIDAWIFVWLDNERFTLNDLIDKKVVDINNIR